MSNPISECHTAILAALRADSRIDALVREGNIIDFVDVPSPVKKGIATADLPEVMLYPTSIRGNIHASSSHVFLTLAWQFQISTGNFKVDVSNELLWAIIKICSNWHTTLRPTLWDGASFVKDVRLANGVIGMSNADANRNIRGWASLVDIETDFGLDLKSVRDA